MRVRAWPGANELPNANGHPLLCPLTRKQSIVCQSVEAEWCCRVTLVVVCGSGAHQKQSGKHSAAQSQWNRASDFQDHPLHSLLR